MKKSGSQSESEAF